MAQTKLALYKSIESRSTLLVLNRSNIEWVAFLTLKALGFEILEHMQKYHQTLVRDLCRFFWQNGALKTCRHKVTSATLSLQTCKLIPYVVEHSQHSHFINPREAFDSPPTRP